MAEALSELTRKQLVDCCACLAAATEAAIHAMHEVQAAQEEELEACETDADVIAALVRGSTLHDRHAVFDSCMCKFVCMHSTGGRSAWHGSHPVGKRPIPNTCAGPCSKLDYCPEVYTGEAAGRWKYAQPSSQSEAMAVVVSNAAGIPRLS